MREVSQETRNKLRIASTGRKKSEEEKLKISNSLKEKWKTRSPETIEKIKNGAREKLKGNKNSAGKKRSESFKLYKKQEMTKRWADKEAREKLIIAFKNRKYKNKED